MTKEEYMYCIRSLSDCFQVKQKVKTISEKYYNLGQISVYHDILRRYATYDLKRDLINEVKLWN